MENSFQTSFIPKKPIIANGAESSVKKTTNISMVISVFVIIATFATSVGLFLYKSYLTKNEADLSASLAQTKGSFDSDTINELEVYDNRTKAATGLLSSHLALSPLFELINSLTLSSIQYTDFSHQNNNGVFSVKMSGIARDYKSIALQADVFNTSKGSMFSDVIFSNLTKDKNNFVTFDLEFNVDPELLSYVNSITNNQPAMADTSSPSN